MLIDTAGQEKFNAIPKQFLTSTNYVIIVYDPSQTKEQIMEQLKYWLEIVENSCKQATSITIIANDKRKLSEQHHNDEFEDIKRELNYHKVNMKYDFTIDDVHYFKGLAEDPNEFVRFKVSTYIYTYIHIHTY